MTKFKVGDKVKLIKRYTLDPPLGATGVVMEAFTDMIVVEFNNWNEGWSIDNSKPSGPCWYVNLDQIDKLEDKPMAKFKVGDKVTLIEREPGYTIDPPIGSTGVVVGVGPLYLTVSWDNYEDGWNWDGYPFGSCWSSPINNVKVRKEVKHITGNKAKVVKHITTTGSISIREAMDDYGMSGGCLTKVISDLKKEGYTISRTFRKHPVTGQRYARYSM